MATDQRLTWGGSLRAQEEADKAWRELQHKAALKKAAAFKSKPKKPSKAQRRKRKKLRKMGQAPPAPGERRRVNYYKYIQSKAWAKRKQRYYESHGKRCQICGSTIAIQLHHRHYRTLGCEEDADLQALCMGCHENEHEGKVRGVVDPMTEAFLALNL